MAVEYSFMTPLTLVYNKKVLLHDRKRTTGRSPARGILLSCSYPLSWLGYPHPRQDRVVPLGRTWNRTFGLGSTPGKDMGSEAGKGSGTRDLGYLPPSSGEQIENINFHRTSYVGGSNSQKYRWQKDLPATLAPCELWNNFKYSHFTLQSIDHTRQIMVHNTSDIQRRKLKEVARCLWMSRIYWSTLHMIM